MDALMPHWVAARPTAPSRLRTFRNSLAVVARSASKASTRPASMRRTGSGYRANVRSAVAVDIDRKGKCVPVHSGFVDSTASKTPRASTGRRSCSLFSAFIPESIIFLCSSGPRVYCEGIVFGSGLTILALRLVSGADRKHLLRAAPGDRGCDTRKTMQTPTPERISSLRESRIENAMFVREHLDCLVAIHSALRFSGRAFLAKGACQLVFESSIIASLDEFAFGVFLLDAAHTIKRLAANSTSEPAAEELCAALRSIGDTHSIFAWVTSGEVVVIVSTFFGLKQLLHDHLNSSTIYSTLSDFATDHTVIVNVFKVVIAVFGLRFGGLRYCRTKLSYWTRASSLAAYLLTDKVARLLGHRPNLVPKDSAKIL